MTEKGYRKWSVLEEEVDFSRDRKQKNDGSIYLL